MSSSKNFTYVRLIGKSAFSKACVYLVHLKSLGLPKALRETDLDKCTLECISYVQKGLWASRALYHPNILVHENAFIEKRKLYVVTEFMSYGACSDLLESYFHFGLLEVFISYALGEVLKALEYVHHQGFIHRGIKACHILVSGNGEIKLSGHRNMISMLDNEQRPKNVHDYPKHDTYLLPWLSPEILQQNMEGYNSQSDIYSLGITACELANGHAPFTDMPGTQMLLEKLNGTKPCLLDHSTIPDTTDENYCGNEEAHQQHEAAKSRRFTNNFHDFVAVCLTREPSLRPTASQLLSHPFLQQCSSYKPNLKQLLHPLVPVTSDMQHSSMDREMGDVAKNVSELSVGIEWDFNDT